ncbi:unnamed protein product [Linum trigynum]|uniref:Ycf54 n=1 Tax=Linum trigynum TaxID=586398 RepID=A0AAV2E5X6_9ROSI
MLSALSLAAAASFTPNKPITPIHHPRNSIFHSSPKLSLPSLPPHLRFPTTTSVKSPVVSAVAVDSSQQQPTSSSSDGKGTSEEAGSGRKRYYFVVANAKFMLDEEEHFQEQLFERRRYYGEREKELDFWLVIEPAFLDKFPDITKRLKRPAVALVSTNGPWITFMKLRLDRVLADSYEADSLEEALASNPTTLEFDKPDNWSAPYPKYEYGWWEAFLPALSTESKV